MAEPGRYLIGESLREKLKSTIAKVDSFAPGSPTSRIKTVIEGDNSYIPKVFRVCTFTGSWAIDTAKTVTFRGVTTTPNTVSVNNVLGTIQSTGDGGTLNCAIAKDGTAWNLISWQDGIVRGTFSAPWAKGATASVTDAVISGVSYTAKNYFANATGSGTKACAIAFVAGEWIVIAAEC